VSNTLAEAFKIEAIRSIDIAEEGVTRITGITEQLWFQILKGLQTTDSRSYKQNVIHFRGVFTKYLSAMRVRTEGTLLRIASTSYTRIFNAWSNTLPSVYWKLAFPDDPAIVLLEAEQIFGDTKRDIEKPKAPKPKYKKGSKKTVKQASEPPNSKRVLEIVRSNDWEKRFDKWSNLVTSKDKIAKAIASGVASGKSTEEVAKKVLPHVKRVHASAIRIVRTESARIHNQMAEETFKQFDSIIGGYQVLNPLDERTRPYHAQRAGRIYWKDQRRKWNVSNRPELPDAPNCRCTYAPVLKKAAPKNLAIGPPVDTDLYAGWFNRQSDATKRRVVGVTRFNAMKRKGIIHPSWYDFISPETGRLEQQSKLGRLSKKRILARRTKLSSEALQKKKEAKRHKHPPGIKCGSLKEAMDFYEAVCHTQYVKPKNEFVPSGIEKPTPLKIQKNGSKVWQLKKWTPEQLALMDPKDVEELSEFKREYWKKQTAKLKKSKKKVILTTPKTPTAKAKIEVVPPGKFTQPAKTLKSGKKIWKLKELSNEQLLGMDPADVAKLPPGKKTYRDVQLKKWKQEKGITVHKTVAKANEKVAAADPQAESKALKRELNALGKAKAILNPDSKIEPHPKPNLLGVTIDEMSNKEALTLDTEWVSKHLGSYPKYFTKIKTTGHIPIKKSDALKYAELKLKLSGKVTQEKDITLSVPTKSAKIELKSPSVKTTVIGAKGRPWSTLTPEAQEFFSTTTRVSRKSRTYKVPKGFYTEAGEKFKATPESTLGSAKKLVKSKAVTRGEHEDIVGYTGMEYLHINKELRSNTVSKDVRSMVNNINGLIQREGELKKPIKVYRGAGSTDMGRHEKFLGTVWKSLEEGGTFSDPAFGSTSLSPKQAMNFGVAPKTHGKPYGDILLEIKAKRGIYVEPITESDGEYEFLMEPGAKLRALKVNTSRGLTVIQCEQVLDDE